MEREYKIKELEQNLNQSCDFLFEFFKQWRAVHGEMTEQEGVAQCILQMIISSSHCLLKLSKGINIIPNNDKFVIVDPSSMIAILRSLYEKVFIFHNVFVQTETEIERNILFNIWIIRGLRNRQGLENVPEKFKSKEKNEKKSLDRLLHETSELINNLLIDSNAKSTMIKTLNSRSSMIAGFKITKDQDQKIIRFEEIKLTSSPKDFLGENLASLYRFLSTHSHPSFLSILQYGQMFNSNDNIHFLKQILSFTILLQIIFILDFCNCIRDAKETFDSLPGVKEFFLEYSESL